MQALMSSVLFDWDTRACTGRGFSKEMNVSDITGFGTGAVPLHLLPITKRVNSRNNAAAGTETFSRE